MKRFEGCTALVTDGSREPGRSVAVGLAGAGAFVHVGYHDGARGARETMKRIEAIGGAGALLPFDGSKVDEVEAAFGLLPHKGAELDILVNCACVARECPLADMSSGDWEELLSVNLTGCFNCCRAVCRHMMERRRGAIVNIGSMAALRARAGSTGCAACQGGIVALTRTLAMELAPHGVRVNTVVPGVLANGGKESPADADSHDDEAARTVPLGRVANPDEVARVVLFLASAGASYMTGQSVVVDGGLSL